MAVSGICAVGELSAVDEQLLRLVSALGTLERRKALRAIGQGLRKSHLQRIRANRQPDGSAMLKRQRGNRAMFKKMGAWLQVKANDEQVQMGFFGRVGWIATNHQWGRSLQKQGRTIHFPVRILVGLSESDKQMVRSLLLQSISTGL